MKKKGILIVILIIGSILLAAAFTGGSPEIDTVRNGYLGTYTDFTVEELLNGHYTALGYGDAEWTSGETNSGKTIVEARFSDDIAIQFTMLNDSCFRVSAYVDPMETTTKPTDLLAVLNYLYLEQYLLNNESSIGNSSFETQLISRLDKISGSAVQYGAAAEYTGSRADLCRLSSESPLEVSVVWLLDNYGYIDMSYYMD